VFLRMLAGIALSVLVLATFSYPAAATPVISIDGSSIVVRLDDGGELASPKLIGAVLSVATTSGTARLRIDAVDAIATPAGLLLLHQFSIERDGIWQPYCEADANGQRGAFPIAGHSIPDGGFDSRALGIEIACTSGALGKCLLMGYLPWAKTAGVPMDRLYRACLRMIRADYCGDGRSWTQAGVSIDVFDRFGLQKPDPSSTMPLEAAWSPQGAVCIQHVRVAGLGSLADIARACPRLASEVGQACDVTGADLFNRSTGTQ
jgi:hypothetical protein